MAPRPGSKKKKSGKHYDIDKIVDHFVTTKFYKESDEEKLSVQFKVTWKWWPEGMGAFTDYEDIKAKDLVKKYLDLQGIVMDYPISVEKLADKLIASSALFATKRDYSISLDSIVAHRVKEGLGPPAMLFMTKWSNGEQFERPRISFEGEQISLLNEYCEQQGFPKKKSRKGEMKKKERPARNRTAPKRLVVSMKPTWRYRTAERLKAKRRYMEKQFSTKDAAIMEELNIADNYHNGKDHMENDTSSMDTLTTRLLSGDTVLVDDTDNDLIIHKDIEEMDKNQKGRGLKDKNLEKDDTAAKPSSGEEAIMEELQFVDRNHSGNDQTYKKQTVYRNMDNGHKTTDVSGEEPTAERSHVKKLLEQPVHGITEDLRVNEEVNRERQLLGTREEDAAIRTFSPIVANLDYCDQMYDFHDGQVFKDSGDMSRCDKGYKDKNNSHKENQNFRETSSGEERSAKHTIKGKDKDETITMLHSGAEVTTAESIGEPAESVDFGEPMVPPNDVDGSDSTMEELPRNDQIPVDDSDDDDESTTERPWRNQKDPEKMTEKEMADYYGWRELEHHNAVAYMNAGPEEAAEQRWSGMDYWAHKRKEDERHWKWNEIGGGPKKESHPWSSWRRTETKERTAELDRDGQSGTNSWKQKETLKNGRTPVKNKPLYELGSITSSTSTAPRGNSYFPRRAVSYEPLEKMEPGPSWASSGFRQKLDDGRNQKNKSNKYPEASL